MALLEVDDLCVTYVTRKRPPVPAVRNVSFSIDAGEFLGLVGESGSGKSTLGNAVIRILDPPGKITGGSIRFDGKDITTLDENQLRPIRWRDISTVFQSSMNSLNPVLTIQSQFEDVYEACASTRMSSQAACASVLPWRSRSPSTPALSSSTSRRPDSTSSSSARFSIDCARSNASSASRCC
jgi:ABC-type glutathione transport system ATPase component